MACQGGTAAGRASLTNHSQLTSRLGSSGSCRRRTHECPGASAPGAGAARVPARLSQPSGAYPSGPSCHGAGCSWRSCRSTRSCRRIGRTRSQTARWRAPPLQGEGGSRRRGIGTASSRDHLAGMEPRSASDNSAGKHGPDPALDLHALQQRLQSGPLQAPTCGALRAAPTGEHPQGGEVQLLRQRVVHQHGNHGGRNVGGGDALTLCGGWGGGRCVCV